LPLHSKGLTLFVWSVAMYECELRKLQAVDYREENKWFEAATCAAKKCKLQ